MIQNIPIKPVLRSTTTISQLAGNGSALTALGAILQLLRTFNVDLPWSPDQDMQLIALVSAAFGPLISRLIASRIKRHRAQG